MLERDVLQMLFNREWQKAEVLPSIESIRVDKSFKVCRWTDAEVDDLLDSLQAHVDAANEVGNRCNEAMITVERGGELQPKFWPTGTAWVMAPPSTVGRAK